MSKGVRTTLGRLFLAAFILAALALAGCGGSSDSHNSTGEAPQHGGTMVAALQEEVDTLDPTTAYSTAGINVLTQIMEPLYRLNIKGEVEPRLVTSVEKSNDEETWVFHLREGVRFSNGKPMTAEDVVFSIETARHSAVWSSLFEAFQTVKATSQATVEITTSQPVPAMEAILSSWVVAIVPKNFGGVSEKTFGEHPIGTGAFKLKKWERGVSITLVRNDQYWKSGFPYLNQLTFKSVPEDSSRISQLLSGELDVIESPPPGQIKSLTNSPGFSIASSAPTKVNSIIINSRLKQFDDPRVREAINLALDREAIAKTASAGQGEPAASFLVPSLPYHDDSLKPPARDVGRAKKLLAEAVADGANPSFTLLVPSGGYFYNLASQIIQSDLDEVGFSVKIEILDGSAIFSEVSEGEYDAALTYLSAGIPDPSENVAYYLSTEAIYTGADTAVEEKLAAEGIKETDTAKRRQIYYRIQEEVAKQNYLIALCYEPFVWGRSDKVAGLQPNPEAYVWYEEAGLAR